MESNSQSLKYFVLLKHIYFVSVLLENATHLVQPLDVRIFASVKKGMEKQLQIWRDANPGKTINKYDLIRAILPALEKGLGNKSLIKEGFRASGLYVEGKGFDPSQVDFSRMKASEVFAQEEEARDGDSAGVTAVVPVTDIPDSLLPITPTAENNSMFVPVTSEHTGLTSAVSSDHTLPVTNDPDVPGVTSDHTALVSSLFRAPNIPELETSGPDVTQLGEHTAPRLSLFRDLTLPVTSVPDALVTSELPAPVSGVSPDPPVTEASDTGVSDNTLSQFTIPLEDRKRRLV